MRLTSDGVRGVEAKGAQSSVEIIRVVYRICELQTARRYVSKVAAVCTGFTRAEGGGIVGLGGRRAMTTAAMKCISTFGRFCRVLGRARVECERYGRGSCCGQVTYMTGRCWPGCA